MNNLSNERLKEIAAHEIGSDAYPRRAEWQAMAKELLARRETEGVVYGPYQVAFMGPGVWAGIPDELPPQLVGGKVWLTTAPQLPAVPDGWALVPIEATPGMLNASWVNHGIHAPSSWRTMLAAAPKPEVK